MDNVELQQLLSNIERRSKERNLSRVDLARQLGIPYSTLKKWFFSGEKGRKPSPGHVAAIKLFLGSESAAESRWDELWARVLEWWQTQHRYHTTRELADEVGWDDSLGAYIQEKRRPPRIVIERISGMLGFLPKGPDQETPEAKQRVQKLKWLLLLLEAELRWFRDASPSARDLVRQELDPEDMGYMSSLMTMLGDEGKFQRWLSFTSNRFNYFRKKGVTS